MKFLQLLIALVVLVYGAVAYEVKFRGDSNVLPLYIDNNKLAKLWNCRYNSTGRVYCEVTLYYTTNKTVQECGVKQWTEHGELRGPAYRCDSRQVSVSNSRHYRLHIKIDERGFNNVCTNAFKHSSTMSSVTLMYNGKTETQFADRTSDVARGTLPSNFGTYRNRKYTFKFVRDKCTFYGDFVSIDAYLA